MLGKVLGKGGGKGWRGKGVSVREKDGRVKESKEKLWKGERVKGRKRRREKQWKGEMVEG